MASKEEEKKALRWIVRYFIASMVLSATVMISELNCDDQHTSAIFTESTATVITIAIVIVATVAITRKRLVPGVTGNAESSRGGQ